MKKTKILLFSLCFLLLGCQNIQPEKEENLIEVEEEIPDVEQYIVENNEDKQGTLNDSQIEGIDTNKTESVEKKNDASPLESSATVDQNDTDISNNSEQSASYSNSPTMTKEHYEGVNYWLYTPKNATENMPLMMYLHGGSGKGDNLELITDVDGFPQYIKEGKLSCDAYIIFPQCSPTQKGWSTMADTLEELIVYVCNRYSLNRHKVSLTGHSMGGTGTWKLAVMKPTLFYKIAPMSGSVKMSADNVTILSSLPVWAFVGENDKIVSPDTSIAMVEALKKLGSEARLTIFEDATHFDVPSLGYLDQTIDIVNWLIR